MSIVIKTMIVSLVTNFGLSVLKIISGFIGNSSSLIADGVHSFSDLSTDVVAIVGSRLSLKPADSKHPFGHGKIEYLTSIVISVLIIGLGFAVISSSFKREIVIPELWMLIVSAVTIIVKLCLSMFVLKRGKKYQNNILIASGKESSTDVLSSVFVFVSIILMQLSNKISIFKYADSVASILLGIFITKTGFELLRDNVSVLLDEQVTDKKYLRELKKIIRQNDFIINIDLLNVLKSGPYFHLIGVVTMNPKMTLEEAHSKIDIIEEELKQYDEKIKYVTIHIEPHQG